jgi:hypothetical protein
MLASAGAITSNGVDSPLTRHKRLTMVALVGVTAHFRDTLSSAVTTIAFGYPPDKNTLSRVFESLGQATEPGLNNCWGLFERKNGEPFGGSWIVGTKRSVSILAAFLVWQTNTRYKCRMLRKGMHYSIN